jgi:hypothetical protein
MRRMATACFPWKVLQQRRSVKAMRMAARQQTDRYAETAFRVRPGLIELSPQEISDFGGAQRCLPDPQRLEMAQRLHANAVASRWAAMLDHRLVGRHRAVRVTRTFGRLGHLAAQGNWLDPRSYCDLLARKVESRRQTSLKAASRNIYASPLYPRSGQPSF